jgi:tRNA A37 threonylcarbamoyladenosine synthetase subunit TsaC/SUA5/YrdC
LNEGSSKSAPFFMSTTVLKIETPAEFAAAVQQAAELLKRGEVVVVPTETVYGLAANALDSDAVRRIYEVKGRPSSNPNHCACRVTAHGASVQCEPGRQPPAH